MVIRLAILGSTGSIGRNTLAVVAHHPDRFQVAALAAGQNIDLLLQQAAIFKPELVCIGDPQLLPQLKERVTPGTRVVCGDEGLVECASLPTADAVVTAVVGARGLAATYAAAVNGKRICLANKEALVAGGALITKAVKEHGAQLLPVDSEHSAIFQCLQAGQGAVSRLFLTASGGPFRNASAQTLAEVTPQQALQHPTWSMGPKITIDSATMMNKGLEVIEAHWLFATAYDDIQVVVHPQSIIHSLVEFVDGSVLAQLGTTDMKLPIQVALLHPERLDSPVERLNPWQMGDLSFDAPDNELFPCLELAYEAGRIGGSMPVVLNAANEIAVELFLADRIAFTDIPKVVEQCMNQHEAAETTTIDEILAVDQQARRAARAWSEQLQR